MADAPRWEDLFPQEPETEPARPAMPPVQQPAEPAQQYPPTQAFPQQTAQPPAFPPQPAAYQPPPQQPAAYQPPPLLPPAQPAVQQQPASEPPAYRAPAEGYQLPPVQSRPAPLVEPPQWQSPPAWPAPPAAQRAAEQQDAPTRAFPAQEAARQDAPTQAFPWQEAAAPEPQVAAPAVQPAAEVTPPPREQAEDPFAALFGGAPAAASTPAPAVQDDDPFASLWAQPTEQAAQPAAVASRPAETPAAEVDPFAGLFASQPATTYDEPRTRRGGRGGGGGDDGGNFGGAGPVGKPKKKRNLLWLKITLPIVLVLAALGGAFAFAWFNYNEQVREVLGIPLPTDYEGTGNGQEVIVTIRSGDIGSDVASTLHQAGVTRTFDAVYDYLVEHPEIGFTPGNWALQGEMSAESAVSALQDPANKVTSSLLIREGTVLPDVLELISATLDIPLEEVQAAAADPAAYGVTGAPSLEGYLFPATYELDGAETAQQILQRLVDETFARLDALGVPVERRHEILTMAGLIQREAGSNPDDFYKVSRVFWNRIEQGMLLESDATVAYGTGNLHTVWTTDAERADPNNPYNTYVHPGLPVGPIGAPGELAMQAALQPADGPWLYFVPINLATGETVFSETVEEHEAAADRLREWCAESEENATYCE